MNFLDRGEEHPEIVAKRRVAENKSQTSKVVDGITNMLLGLFAGLFAQVSGVFHSSVHAMAGSVEEIIYPIFGKVRNLEAIIYWSLAAIPVSGFVGYVVYRRFKRKYISVDLSRSGI